MKPDFGLKLIHDGVSSDLDLSFFDFVMVNLTVLDRGRYSTMLDRVYEGEWYALSLDFNQQQLEAILSNAAPAIAERLRAEISRDPSSPRSIDFEQEVRFGVRARLGALQRSQTEAFVPLVCQDILAGPDVAPAVRAITDPVIVTVSREGVDCRRIGETLRTLQAWVETCSDAHDVRGRLQLAFDGYDSEHRELWTIPEVREFVGLLDQEFPFWFYLADLHSDVLKVVAFCLCRVSSSGPGATAIHPEDFAAFLQRHFSAMNELLEHWSVGDAENESVSNEIVSYFEATRILS